MSEADVGRLRRFEAALQEIRDYPVGNPVAEFKLRLIASLALAEEDS